MCDRLLDDEIRPGITFGISPILCEQLSHPDFAELFVNYCRDHAELARVDHSHMVQEGAPEEILRLAAMWEEWYLEKVEDFQQKYESNIVGALRRLQDSNAIEVMTCAATHGYLPLLAEDASVDLQVDIAVRSYQRHFGAPPRGIWLPECAYRPAYSWRTLLPVSAYSTSRPRKGVEQVLAEHNLSYFVTDEGALKNSMPLGMKTPDGQTTPYSETYGKAREILDERSVFDVFSAGSNGHPETTAFFTRHPGIALQVWSGQTGYPGDPDYLDFHKKYFRSAHRFWRVTDSQADMGMKQPYVPEWASSKVATHAKHFANILETSVRHRESHVDRESVVCLPFDTELFGHWWFEGPQFLEGVIREIHRSELLKCTTASESLSRISTQYVVALPESSWGRNGDDSVWMNPDTEWTWEREYQLEYRVRMLFEKHPLKGWDNTMSRIVRNVVRQLLLVQASDWQFLISTFSAKNYAEMRFHNHSEDAKRLCNIAEKYGVTRKISKADIEYVDGCELRDGMFSEEIDGYLRDHGA